MVHLDIGEQIEVEKEVEKVGAMHAWRLKNSKTRKFKEMKMEITFSIAKIVEKMFK
jgi:hypothetical protein